MNPHMKKRIVMMAHGPRNDRASEESICVAAGLGLVLAMLRVVRP